jgi:hypothetical protein
MQQRQAAFQREFFLASSHQSAIEAAQADHYARLQQQAAAFFAANEQAWNSYLSSVTRNAVPALMNTRTSTPADFASTQPVTRLTATPTPTATGTSSLMSTRTSGGDVGGATMMNNTIHINGSDLSVRQLENAVLNGLSRVMKDRVR